MTNEALAILIQSGKREYEAQLWAQIERFIEYKARCFGDHLTGSAADIEDLKQSGYFAMLEAVRYFRPEKEYSFLTYLKWTLKRSFAEVAGIRSSKRNPERFAAYSLDEPIIEAEEGDSRKAFLVDEHAQEPFAEVETIEYTYRVRAALLEAMRPLSEKKQNVLFLHYYGGMTFDEVARVVGYGSGAGAEQAHYEAVRFLKCYRGRALWRLLKGYDEFDIYAEATSRTGLQSFFDNDMSSTERVAFVLMKWRRLNGM